MKSFLVTTTKGLSCVVSAHDEDHARKLFRNAYPAYSVGAVITELPPRIKTSYVLAGSVIFMITVLLLPIFGHVFGWTEVVVHGLTLSAFVVLGYWIYQLIKESVQ